MKNGEYCPPGSPGYKPGKTDKEYTLDTKQGKPRERSPFKGDEKPAKPMSDTEKQKIRFR